jgi:hypothetical protein
VPKLEKWKVGEGTVLANEEADHARWEVRKSYIIYSHFWAEKPGFLFTQN